MLRLALTWAACDIEPDVPPPESCEVRLVDWNASGSELNLGHDIDVAEAVIDFVGSHDADVVTLQEVTDATLDHLEANLADWDCRASRFGLDNIAICVKGTGSGFSASPLGDYSDEEECPVEPSANWGYVQLEHEGVVITSAHARECWDEQHVRELHEEVTTGVVGGDLALEAAAEFPADLPDWFQTDLDLEWTWEGDRDGDGTDEQLKVDHILTVEEPAFVWGTATGDGSPVDKKGSDHRPVLGVVHFPADDPEVTPTITNPQQPLAVDDDCLATVTFDVALHDACCLDPDALDLVVTASNPTSNLTLGPVVIDSVVAIDPREVAVTGHVDVSAVESCPAEVVIDVVARDCAGRSGDTLVQGTSARVEVVDTIPPFVEGGDDDLYCLWPPNHQYVCFVGDDFDDRITDNCDPDPSWEFVSCTSDQPDNANGDGNTVDDCTLPADQEVCARAERIGGDPAGRRYDLEVEARDACSNPTPTTALGSLYVPHDQSPNLECVGE